MKYSESIVAQRPFFDVLGVHVSAICMDDAIATISEWIARKEPNYVCVRDVNGVMESDRDGTLKAINNQAGMVTPDGMPLVWLAHAKGQKHVRRVYGPDLMLEVFKESESRQWTHYLYGGRPGIGAVLETKLNERFPNARIVGICDPPRTESGVFRDLTSAEETQLLGDINAAAPDIVWVGIGTPRQERWMARYRGQLDAPVLIGVGAAFDFHSGVVRQAPRWMQRSGLEWVFRLLSEPRRLWRRYLRNNPEFIFKIALQAVGLRTGNR